MRRPRPPWWKEDVNTVVYCEVSQYKSGPEVVEWGRVWRKRQLRRAMEMELHWAWRCGVGSYFLEVVSRHICLVTATLSRFGLVWMLARQHPSRVAGFNARSSFQLHSFDSISFINNQRNIYLANECALRPSTRNMMPHLARRPEICPS
jgi:hypothetical protein